MSYGGEREAARLRATLPAPHDHEWVAGEIIGRDKYGWVVGSNCTICRTARYESFLTAEDRTLMESLGLT